MVTSELTPIPTTEPVAADPPVVARLEAAGEQTGAITFTLDVVNVSTEAVSLSNPYDGVTYTLSDEEGWPIGLPAPGRRGKVNGPARSRAGKASYLVLRAIEADGAEIAPDGGVEADEFTLGPASSCRFTLEIANRAAKDEGGPPQPLTPGTYHLVVLLPLAWTVGGSNDRLIVRSEEITITLTAS